MATTLTLNYGYMAKGHLLINTLTFMFLKPTKLIGCTVLWRTPRLNVQSLTPAKVNPAETPILVSYRVQ